MEIEGFDEIINTIYIAKKLHDIGKYDLVNENFYDVLCYDAYFENMCGLIPSLFEHFHSRYSERQGMELHVMSDPVIVDFYKLAGEYGRERNISDEANPYISEAEEQARSWLSFSYCLDWKLIGYTEPKRPFQSRLVLFIYQDDWTDLGCLAYGLIEIREWFSDACARLKAALHKDEPAATPCLREEVMAA